MIRGVLTGAREHLLGTLRAIGDDRLDEIPEALRERKIAVRDVFFLLGLARGAPPGAGAPDLQSLQSEPVVDESPVRFPQYGTDQDDLAAARVEHGGDGCSLGRA